jgi:putative ABC transport system ATP-binding protein
MNDSGPAAACQDVAKEYVTAGERVMALSGITVRFEPGHITVLAGPSGSGKSTLLRLLSCIDRPTEGAVSVDGIEVSSLNGRRRRALRRRRLGYLFQSPADNLLAYLSASDHLRFAASLRGAPLVDGGEELLARMGLTAQANRRPHELSGGEQQRLALAAAVVGQPALVVADEPTAQLDVGSAGSVLSALSALRDLGSSFVISSHDDQVMGMADRVLYLRHGELVA